MTAHKLDPLPTKPWSEDVRIWRVRDRGDVVEVCRASIPRTVIWHSPDGFNFGYGGSGPAELALNILNAFVPPRELAEPEKVHDRPDFPLTCFFGVCSLFALRYHQAFKREFIQNMAEPGGTIFAETILYWIDYRLAR